MYQRAKAELTAKIIGKQCSFLRNIEEDRYGNSCKVCSVTHGESAIEAKQGRTSNFIIAADHIWILGASLKRQNTCSLWRIFKIIKKQRRFAINHKLDWSLKSWKRFLQSVSYEYLRTGKPEIVMVTNLQEFKSNPGLYSCNGRCA